MRPRRRSSPETTATPDGWTAGVDGCRGGWLVVLAGWRAEDAAPLRGTVRLCSTFAQVLRLRPRPLALAVDMPVGLLERAQRGGRNCDQAARVLLGPRAASVFSPPARAALESRDYRDAIRRNGGGMSLQAYNILPRIRELDAAMSVALQQRVFEAHPELVFARLGGRPMRAPKRTEAGRRERLECLRAVWGGALPDLPGVRAQLGARAVGLDDMVDACALAHAARQILLGSAHRLPPTDPPRDARGLRMEIWF